MSSRETAATERAVVARITSNPREVIQEFRQGSRPSSYALAKLAILNLVGAGKLARYALREIQSGAGRPKYVYTYAKRPVPDL